MDIKKNQEDKNWWQPALILFTRWSVWITAPILLGTFVGKGLDKHFGTEPILFLASTGVSFIFSIGYLVYNVSREYKKIDKK